MSKNQSSPLSSFLGFWSEPERLRREKARLEAFLQAVPGDYCGWSPDGSVAYSAGFAHMLGLSGIGSIGDIQSALAPGDGAALEGMFGRLTRQGQGFSLAVRNRETDKTFKITGSRGTDLSGDDFFDVLWIEDITQQIAAQKKAKERQQEQQQTGGKYESAMQKMPRALWMRDDRQKLIWCNQAYADLLGMNVGDVLAQQKELVQEPKKSGVTTQNLAGPQMAKTAYQSNQNEMMHAHVIASGQRRYMRLIEIPMKDHQASLGVALDVTREEDLQNEMTLRRQSTRSLLEQLRTAIGIFDVDQRLEFYNSSYTDLWGLEAGWLNTRPSLGEIMEKLREIRRLPEQSDFRRFKQSWLAMFTDLIDSHDDMLYLPDGSVVRMLVIPQMIGGVIMIFEDVTSRLELESSYNTLVAVQRETLDNLGEAVAVYGGDGRLRLSNPSFGRMWGLHPEDLEGQPHITSLVDKMKPKFPEKEWDVQRIDLVSKGLDRLMHEGRLKCEAGTLIDFTTVPLPDGGVLVTYIDVTDSVRVENALREKNAALEEAEQLKLDFLANVSYQLRTPLNAIMGFNEILDQQYFGPLNDRQREYTKDMRIASEKLLSLINDILDLSTIEAGQLSLEVQSFNLSEMLDGVVDIMEQWAMKKQISITCTCPKNMSAIRADETRLKQVLVNLIRNAITFTPEGGSIDVSARKTKGGLVIAVKDTGVGISKADLTKIWEPFERTGDIQDKDRGAGLGLSIVKNIIDMHGGDISVESTLGKGTQFTMTLPQD